MASKVNTKFVLILVVAIACAGALIGGMYVLNERNNTQRNIKRAEEAFAAGEIEKAFGYYGRAAHKDPGNLALLDKLVEMISLLTAPNEVKARERYQDRIQILRQAARHNPTSAEAHLRVLRELHTSGRIYPDPGSFLMMASAADDMWNGVSDLDKQRSLAPCYRAISKSRLLEQRTTDELIESEHEVQAVVDADPEHDLGWASLVITQMAIGEKYRTEGRSKTAITEHQKRVDATVAKAMQSVPNGPETAFVNLRWLNSREGARDSADSKEQIRQASDHLIKQITKDSDPGFVAESIDLLAGATDDGIQRVIPIVRDYLEHNPNAIDKRIRLAKLYYFVNDLDGAEREARLVFDCEPLKTSFLAQLQFPLKQEAAGVMVDVANRRWTVATPEAKPTLLKALEDARNVLAGVVDRPSDPQVLRADGKIAYAKGDFNRAASLFEQVIHSAGPDGAIDREVLLYTADSLERIGQVGLAHERLSQLMSSSSNTPDWVRVKAQMEYRMGRYDAAAKTLAELPQSELERPETRDMIQEIQRRKDSPLKLQNEDPIYAALSQASNAMNRGDIQSARTVLEGALAQAPENLGVLQAIAQVEIRDGKNEKAREYVDKARALAPNDELLKRIDAVLKNEDPIEAAEQYHAEAFQDEFVRSLSLAATLTELSRQQTAQGEFFESKGNSEAAAKAKSTAERAKASADANERRATELNPDHRDLIEYKFLKALDAKNWELAEHLVSRARELNSDQADGAFFRGRLELYRGNHQDAVRALESASDKLSYSSFVWRALAIAYQNLHNDAQALRAFEQAYKCNPNDVVAAKAYVNLLLRVGEPIRALSILRPLRQMIPQDIEARNLWIELEGQVGDRALAIRTRRLLYKENPRDPSNTIRLAQLFSNMEPSRELILNDAGTPVLSDARWDRMSMEEREQYLSSARAEWKSQADAMLSALLALNDDQLEPPNANTAVGHWKLAAASARAHLLREQGKMSEGEQVLREFIAGRSEATLQAQMLIELGRYQAQCSHFTEAFATLKEAVQHQDPKIRGADQELASLYIQLNQNEEAIKHIDELIAANPENIKFIQQKAECLLKTGKSDEAEALVRDLIKSKGEDYISTMLLATIAQVRAEEALAKGDAAEAERKIAEQRVALAKAQTQQPNDFRPQVLLAHSLIAEAKRSPQRKDEALNEALRILDRAEKSSPGAWETLIARLVVLREKKQLVSITSELRTFVEKNPDNIAARRELVQLHLDQKDADAAIAVVDDAIGRNPTLPVWHEAKGDLHRMGQQDLASAVMAYEKADAIAKKSSTLAKFVETALLMPQPRCAEIARRLSERPEDLASVPFLREAYARVLKCQKLDQEALEQAKLAYQRRREIIAQGFAKPQEIGPWYEVLVYLFPAPNSTVDASAAENFVLEQCNPKPDIWDLVSMSRMWFLAGDGNRAIEVQQRAISQCPAAETKLRARLTLDLANTYTSIQKYDQATAAYNETLQLDPDNIEALNNYSYLLAESMGQPLQAIPYAERAVQQAPGNAAVLDTLGWIHNLAGNQDKARQLLEEAVKIDPTALGTVIHLAEVLYKAGDFSACQQQLDNAVKLSPDAVSQQAIDKMKTDIRNGRPRQ
jgi:tetratricopeptide (TPR) repeat protein